MTLDTDGFKHLLAHVATSAYDSPDHVDAPKCHPNTRKAVLDEIMNWIILMVARTQWILWLNGAAGAGKSAIGRSIVDLCISLASSFSAPTLLVTMSPLSSRHLFINCCNEYQTCSPSLYPESNQTHLSSQNL